MVKATKPKQRSNSAKANQMKGLIGNTFRDKPERINRKGRPTKIYSQMAELGYSRSQVNDTFMTMFALSLKELRLIRNSISEKYTAVEKTVASVILKAFKNGEIRDMETLMARVFGGPNTKIALDIGLTAKANKKIFIPHNGRDEKEIIELGANDQKQITST